MSSISGAVMFVDLKNPSTIVIALLVATLAIIGVVKLAKTLKDIIANDPSIRDDILKVVNH